MGDTEYKNRHKELGLCTDCSEPVYRGRKKCLKHLRLHSISRQKYRAKNLKKCTEADHELKRQRKKDLKCWMCSAPLDPDADYGCLNCVNCRGKTFAERYINGIAIV